MIGHFPNASVEEDEKRDADVMARFKTYAIFEFLTKGDIMARLEVMAYVTWSDMGSCISTYFSAFLCISQHSSVFLCISQYLAAFLYIS